MSFVRGLLPVRRGERGLAAFLFGFLTLMVLADWLGKIGADSLFVKRLGVEYVPLMYVVTPVVMLVTSALIFAFVDRIRGRTLLLGYVTLVAVASVAIQIAIPIGGIVLPIAYVFAHGVKETIYLLFWIYAGSLYDSEQSKRLFPIFAAAVLVGKIAGGAIAAAVVDTIHSENLMGTQAVGFAVCIALVALWWKRLPDPGRGPADRRVEPRDLRRTLAGASAVARDDLLRGFGIGIFLWYFLMQIGSYLYLVGLDVSSLLRDSRQSEDLFSQLYASVYTTSTIAALALQLLVAGPLVRRLGVAKSLFVLPLWYLLSYGAALVAFSFFAAVAIQLGERIVIPALHRPASEIVYTQVADDARARARAFLSGGVNAAGNIAAALLLIATTALGSSTAVILAVATACSALFLANAGWLRGAIGRRLAANLMSPDASLRRNAIFMLPNEADAVPADALEEIASHGDRESAEAARWALARRGTLAAVGAVHE